MATNDVKRREPNLVFSERSILMDIVQKHLNVVENKKTDWVTVAEKKKEWEIIATEFNVASGLYHRSSQFLKQSWDNIRKRTKKSVAEKRVARFQTGGGPPPKVPKEEGVEDKLLSILGPTVQGFHNEFDDDADLTLPVPEIVLCEGPINNDNDDADDPLCKDPETTTDQDWSSHTPHMLRQPVSSDLRNADIYGVHDIPLEASNDNAATLSHAAERPLRSTYSRPKTSVQYHKARRRPNLATSSTDSVHKAKIDYMEVLKRQSVAEHKLNMEILQERLKQEKLRTLWMETEMKKNSSK